jgi:hypothetical protein
MHWAREYAGAVPGQDDARGLQVTPHGEVVIAGVTSGVPFGSPPVSHADALVQEYDPLGTLLWQRRVDLGRNEHAFAIERDPASGDLFVGGGSSPTSASPNGPLEWLLWRLDGQTGAIVWQRKDVPAGVAGGGGNLTNALAVRCSS